MKLKSFCIATGTLPENTCFFCVMSYTHDGQQLQLQLIQEAIYERTCRGRIYSRVLGRKTLRRNARVAKAYARQCDQIISRRDHRGREGGIPNDVQRGW